MFAELDRGIEGVHVDVQDVAPIVEVLTTGTCRVAS
jgi:hypothetical protein